MDKDELVLWWTRCTIPVKQKLSIVIKEAIENQSEFFINLFDEVTEIRDGHIYLKECYGEKTR